MRTFVALELPAEFVNDIAALCRTLEASVEGRFLARETYHITLAFLGEIDDAQVSRAMDALDAAGAEAQPVSLRSDGLGKFGRSSDATLWMGIAPTPELSAIAFQVREELERHDVSFDNKPFKAHVTLARRARIPKGKFPTLAFPREAQATRVTLFKSELAAGGATYKPLYTVELG